MKPLRIFLMATAIIVAGTGIYKIGGDEKIAYGIRREEANMRENAIHTQEERMEKEGAERAATGRDR